MRLYHNYHLEIAFNASIISGIMAKILSNKGVTDEN